MKRLLYWLMVSVLSGCTGNDGPELARVTGTVTRAGKPVPDLLVYFQPEVGRPSWGLTDASGEFKLYYTKEQDGAVFGEHRVNVQFNQSQPQSFAGAGQDSAKELNLGAQVDGEPAAPAVSPAALSNEDRREIVSKFGKPEKSPLRVTIDKDGQRLRIPLD